jgi:hypothetical protein
LRSDFLSTASEQEELVADALTCVEDEYVVDDSFLAVAFSASEDNEELTELSGRMAVAG